MSYIYICVKTSKIEEEEEEIGQWKIKVDIDSTVLSLKKRLEKLGFGFLNSQRLLRKARNLNLLDLDFAEL